MKGRGDGVLAEMVLPALEIRSKAPPPNWAGLVALQDAVERARVAGKLPEQAEKFRRRFALLNLPPSRRDLVEEFNKSIEVASGA